MIFCRWARNFSATWEGTQGGRRWTGFPPDGVGRHLPETRVGGPPAPASPPPPAGLWQPIPPVSCTPCGRPCCPTHLVHRVTAHHEEAVDLRGTAGRCSQAMSHGPAAISRPLQPSHGLAASSREHQQFLRSPQEQVVQCSRVPWHAAGCRRTSCPLANSSRWGPMAQCTPRQRYTPAGQPATPTASQPASYHWCCFTHQLRVGLVACRLKLLPRALP